MVVIVLVEVVERVSLVVVSRSRGDVSGLKIEDPRKEMRCHKSKVGKGNKEVGNPTIDEGHQWQ